MMKFKNPFRNRLTETNTYKEKDQRIVTRWLKECEDEKLTADEMLDLCLRFVVCVCTSLYEPVSWQRKAVIKRFDERLKVSFDALRKQNQIDEDNKK